MSFLPGSLKGISFRGISLFFFSVRYRFPTDGHSEGCSCQRQMSLFLRPCAFGTDAPGNLQPLQRNTLGVHHNVQHHELDRFGIIVCKALSVKSARIIADTKSTGTALFHADDCDRLIQRFFSTIPNWTEPIEQIARCASNTLKSHDRFLLPNRHATLCR